MVILESAPISWYILSFGSGGCDKEVRLRFRDDCPLTKAVFPGRLRGNGKSPDFGSVEEENRHGDWWEERVRPKP